MIIDTETVDIEELRYILTERIKTEKNKTVQTFVNKLRTEIKNFEQDEQVYLFYDTGEDCITLLDILLDSEWTFD